MSRQVLILTKEEVVNFYELHGLLPGATIPATNFPAVLRAANKRSESFSMFVFESVSKTDNKVELRPDIISWEKLFNYYCFFIVGYSGIKLSQADAKGPH